jgi:hypothetical protein
LFLLDLDLDGQAVAVPAGLALDAEAPHRLVAAHDVLHRPGQDVPGMGHAVRGRRAFEEDEVGLACTDLDAALERLVLLPEADDAALELVGAVGLVVGQSGSLKTRAVKNRSETRGSQGRRHDLRNP